MDTQSCSKYIWEDLSLLFKSYYVYCSQRLCITNIVNHIIFVFILLILIGGFLAQQTKTHELFGYSILIGSVYALYWLFMYNKEKSVEPPKIQQTTVKENFETNAPVNSKVLAEEVIGSEVTYPTAKNPFMNVLVNEIKYNPYRSKAASVFDPEVAVGLEDFFKTQFINDPTDVFGKSQSQRQFYTTPSTTVPNDQDSYQNWLYKIPGKTCKEGGREACSSQSGSAGGVIPWLTEN